MRLRRREISPYRLYLTLESGTAFLLGISYATVTVYWVTTGRLNPLHEQPAQMREKPHA